MDVEVVSPAAFRHFGLAYGDGIVGNLRRRPWLVGAAPALPALVRARGAPGCARRGSRPRALASVRAPGARDAGSRSSSSSGERTSSSRGGRRGLSPARAPRAARPLPLGRRSRRPRERSAPATCASCRAGSRSPTASLSPRSRRTCSTSAGSRRRRASTSSRRRRTGMPRVIVGDGPLRDASSRRGRLRPAERARAVLRAGRGRRRARRAARATGSSPARRWPTAAGRRSGGRRARRRGRGRRHGAARASGRPRRAARRDRAAARGRGAPGASRRGRSRGRAARLLVGRFDSGNDCRLQGRDDGS